MDIAKLRFPAWTESDGQSQILHPEQVPADMNEAAAEIERLRAALLAVPQCQFCEAHLAARAAAYGHEQKEDLK
jgi:hypothetical protein